MSMRWVRWLGGAILVVLLAWFGWRLSNEIPEKVRKGEEEIVAAAARYGLSIRYGEVKFHPLHFFISINDIEVRDALADRFLGRAGNVEVSLSPLRLLRGEIPVSRFRVRNFRIEAGERNRRLYERISSGKNGSGGTFPEILFVDGTVLLGPLGPVRRLEAEVRELRIRERRFFGTKIHVAVARAAGQVKMAGQGIAAWPFPSIDADLVRKGEVIKVGKARAWGDASSLRFSGFLETGKRLVDVKAHGEVDLGKWIAAGLPGASYARRAVRGGRLEFSASVSGPWNNPDGTARVALRDADFHGTAVTNGDATLSVKGRVVRIDRMRAKLLGGVFDAAGSYGVDTEKAEGSASLRHFSLADVPWSELGVPVRLAGTADLEVAVSGTPDRLAGDASLSLPGGLERLPSGDTGAFRIRVPLSAKVSAGLSGNRTLRLETVRLRAGRAEIRGSGETSLADGTLKIRGSLEAPSGKASEYGFAYPVRWEGLEGEWEVSGPVKRPRTTVFLRTPALGAWSLPPVPVAVKVDGVPAEALHFVGTVQADSFKLTAVGTATAPADPRGRRVDVSVSAREIDLKEGGRWVSAVLDSLGEKPGRIREYLDGTKGVAEAGGRIAFGPAKTDVSGYFRSKGASVRGISLDSVKAEGEYSETAEGSRWKVKGEGRLGDGIVRVAANGSPGNGTEATADIGGLNVSRMLALLKRSGTRNVEGTLDATIHARKIGEDWEFPRISAASKELSVGTARISGIRAEGALGPAGGKFVVGSDSPRMTLSADVRRVAGWPTKVSLSLFSVPTSFLLAAGGSPEIASEGVWSATLDGVVRMADLTGGGAISPGTFPELHGTLQAEGPAVGAVRFRNFRASVGRKADSLAGELSTGGPDSRLDWELSLKEPFGFRVQGPFTVGELLNEALRDDKRRFSVSGRVRIHGALGELDRTTGTVRVDSLTYRESGWELSGKGLEAVMDPKGIRWDRGTLLAAGAPVRVSGKMSWQGDLDVRVDGKLPAGVVRLAVPGVFDRLDGIVTLDIRVTGNRSDPTIVGTGKLEGGVLSFRGYAQQFDSLKADAVLSREKIVFEHFEGRSGGGYLDGWGEVPFSMDAGQRIYFSVDFFDMRYPYPADLQPVVQGHVELLGPVDDLLATGDVEVQSARYTKNMYPEKALLDFSRRLSDASARREKSEFRVRLDIDVVADRTLRIRNNLGDVSASGEFKVTGDTGKVIILGSFDAYEGYVEFYGNRYELKRANVDFQDPRRNNPQLDVRAETTKGYYSIAVLVSGTLEKPEVDFTSDPPLGRTDIISLLSFGVTTQALSESGTHTPNTTGVAGGAAIAIGSFGGVDEKIRGAVGLDKFSIETGFSQTTQSFEPRFVVRKSFEDRFSVSLSQSVGTSSETSASGEIRLHKNVFLEGGWQSSTSSTPGQVSGDLKLRYRFPSLKELLNAGD